MTRTHGDVLGGQRLHWTEQGVRGCVTPRQEYAKRANKGREEREETAGLGHEQRQGGCHPRVVHHLGYAEDASNRRDRQSQLPEGPPVGGKEDAGTRTPGQHHEVGYDAREEHERACCRQEVPVEGQRIGSLRFDDRRLTEDLGLWHSVYSRIAAGPLKAPVGELEG